MFKKLLSRLQPQNHERQRRAAQLSAADAAALADQALPDPRRVLVLRHDSIGDYLLYRPWLRQLSELVRSRGQQLTLAANALWAPLAQAWDADLFDELLSIDMTRFAQELPYRADILRTIGLAGYGEVIYAPHVREAAIENFIRFLHAPVRIASEGEHGDDTWAQLLNAGYTQLLPATPQILFEYDRNGEFFRHYAAARHAACPPSLPALVLPASLQAAATQAPYIVLFPGASAKQKRWPVAHFARLARSLHRHYSGQYELVIAGSPADAPYASQIAQAAGPAVPIRNRCGQTDLPGLASLLAGAALVISNDTVAAHLAVQAATPCLVLLMGENFGKFFPYPAALLHAPCRCLFPPSQEARFARGDFRTLRGRSPDLSQLTPDRVLATAQELL